MLPLNTVLPPTPPAIAPNSGRKGASKTLLESTATRSTATSRNDWHELHRNEQHSDIDKLEIHHERDEKVQEHVQEDEVEKDDLQAKPDLKSNFHHDNNVHNRTDSRAPSSSRTYRESPSLRANNTMPLPPATKTPLKSRESTTPRISSSRNFREVSSSSLSASHRNDDTTSDNTTTGDNITGNEDDKSLDRVKEINNVIKEEELSARHNVMTDNVTDGHHLIDPKHHLDNKTNEEVGQQKQVGNEVVLENINQTISSRESSRMSTPAVSKLKSQQHTSADVTSPVVEHEPVPPLHNPISSILDRIDEHKEFDSKNHPVLLSSNQPNDIPNSNPIRSPVPPSNNAYPPSPEASRRTTPSIDPSKENEASRRTTPSIDPSKENEDRASPESLKHPPTMKSAGLFGMFRRKK